MILYFLFIGLLAKRRRRNRPLRPATHHLIGRQPDHQSCEVERYSELHVWRAKCRGHEEVGIGNAYCIWWVLCVWCILWSILYYKLIIEYIILMYLSYKCVLLRITISFSWSNESLRIHMLLWGKKFVLLFLFNSMLEYFYFRIIPKKKED